MKRHLIRMRYVLPGLLLALAMWSCYPGGPENIADTDLVFTYYSADLQTEIVHRLADRLFPGGYLVIGAHESLPEQMELLRPLADCSCILGPKYPEGEPT